MKLVEVKVPGKVMLAGEYAILKGSPCVATTVDRYMHIKISEPLSREAGWQVSSDLWSSDYGLEDIPPVLEDNPLIQLLRYVMTHYRLPPLRVEISSQFAVSDGLGSSSALRLGVLCGLAKAFPAEFLPDIAGGDAMESMARLAWHLQKEHQGFASGYDTLTQFHGGFIHFRPDYEKWPGELTPLTRMHVDWLHLFTGGQGAPTASVTYSTQSWLKAENLETSLIDRSNLLTEKLRHTLGRLEAPSGELFQAVGQLRSLFEKSPHYPHGLLRGLSDLEGKDRDWSYKTSGAGGEDAILLFGSEKALAKPMALLRAAKWQKLPVRFGVSGVHTVLPADNLNKER